MNKKGNKPVKNLYSRISALPTENVNIEDIKSLALSLIQEVPLSTENAAFSKVKLEALRLLLDCVKNESDNEIEQELLDLLSGKQE